LAAQNLTFLRHRHECHHKRRKEADKRQTPPVTRLGGQKKSRFVVARLAKLATLARRRQMARNFTLPFPYYQVTDESPPPGAAKHRVPLP